MPSGMIMDRDTPADGMRDMAVVDPHHVSVKDDVGTLGAHEREL